MANIPISPEQWASVSDEDRKRIEGAFRQLGLMRESDNLVRTEGAAAAVEWDPIKDLCRAACDTAAGAAVAWCTANTGGAATVLCIAAAEAARQECRRRC